MLRKLLILTLGIASLGFAQTDVAVENATCIPYPAVVHDTNEISATLVNYSDVDLVDVPIHGIIDSLHGTTELLAPQGFEDTLFPPADWDQITTNDDTLGEYPYTWFRGALGDPYQNDSYAAYVWASDTTSAQDEWLITPQIDLSDVSESDIPKLIFSSSFTPAPQDLNLHHFLCVSTDGGETWADTLADLARDYFEPEAHPERILIDDPPNPFVYLLSDYIGDTIVVGFNYASDGTAGGEEFLQSLDDVSVVAENYEAVWTADETTDSLYYQREGVDMPIQNHIFETPWIPQDSGVYRLTVWTSQAQDENPENDTCRKEIKAGTNVDLEMYRIVRPQDVQTPAESFVPECVIVNHDAEEKATASAICRISSEGPNYYEDSTTVTIQPDSAATVLFEPFPVGPVGTEYDAVFYVRHPLDLDSTNNALEKGFESGYPHYVVPVETVTPQEGDELSSFNPQAVYENQGIYAENDWWAVVTIEEQTLSSVWKDSVHVTQSLDPGAQITITFSEFTAAENQNYTCTFSSEMNIEDLTTPDLDVSFSGKEEQGAIEEGIMPTEYSLGISSSILADEFTVKYAMPKSEHLDLKLYDVSGKLVEQFIKGPVPAGYGRMSLDTDEIPAGLYFLRMDTPGFSATRKVVVVR